MEKGTVPISMERLLSDKNIEDKCPISNNIMTLPLFPLGNSGFNFGTKLASI